MKKLTLAALAFCFLGCSFWKTNETPAESAAVGKSTTTKEAAKLPSDGRLVPRGIDFAKAPNRIAFGSSANQDLPQPIWKGVVNAQPDLFLFVGDTVDLIRDGQTMAEQYKKLSHNAEYREAREKIPFMAIWNSHDYGTTAGGADATTKSQARKEFLAHWRYLRDSIPLDREGLYHAKMIGGQVTGKRRKRVQGPTVQVIMLDTRSFRSPLKPAENPEPLHQYDPVDDAKATILGEEQWKWLEDELHQSADIRFVVTPIQLIASQQGFEKWANFPKERERFFNLLKKTHVKNLIVLSGDRHLAAISKTEIKGWGTLYDITSSSLNQTSDLAENDPAYLQPAYTQENFGLASIDWHRKSVLIEVRDVSGKPIESVTVKLH